MLIDDIKNAVKCDRLKLRGFGLLMGSVCAALGLIALFKKAHSYPALLALAAVFILPGITYPKVLTPVYKIWMAFAAVMGWAMTRLLLVAVFYFVVTPIGLLARLFGKDLLNIRFDRSADSYWVERAALEQDAKSYEKQF